MLREAGYRQRSERRELVLHDPENQAEFFYLQPRGIAVYVGSGRLDVGITGRDLLLDSGAAAEEILLWALPDRRSFATHPGLATDIRDFDGLRIASSYPGLVAKHLADAGSTRR